MVKKKKTSMEYRYYDMPPDEPVLALLGDGWKRKYGEGIKFLHFHNILEIGYCHYGRGELTYDVMEDELLCRKYAGGEVSVIPRSIPHTTNSAPGSVCYWEYLFVDVTNFLGEYTEKNPIQAEKVIERINARPLLIKEEEHTLLTDAVKGILRVQKEKQPYYMEITNGLVFTMLMLIAQANRAYSKQNEESSSV
ncbi:MAG TPA: AraC family transcriptional regulator, partial [Lachnospiraceae bacterium]|nr:AraC family transcriptional regulator [Lachnospiraceae bacterium]